MMPFIQSVYWASVLMSSSGSACAANVAAGAQKARQTSHPRPASQAAKKASATLVMDVMTCLLFATVAVGWASYTAPEDGRTGHGQSGWPMYSVCPSLSLITHSRVAHA